MSKKSKNKKEESEIHRLRSEIRELKAINRTLLRQLKKLNRGSRRQADLEEMIKEFHDEESHEETESESKCPECFGILKTVSLGTRHLDICDNCGYRTKTRIVKLGE